MDDSFLAGTALFRGVSAEETKKMLACLGAYEKRYRKGETILRAGEPAASMGLVLSGSVCLTIDDAWGNSTMLGRAGPGELFAETYACVPGEKLMVNASAGEDSEVLFLSAARLLTTCGSACPYHSALIRNLLRISAMKNLALSRRSVHTAPKTIRGRLTSYLSEQARRAGGSRFTIPFDRQQLADYLGVDRSALSNELSKMRRDGLLDFEKNRFSLAERQDRASG